MGRGWDLVHVKSVTLAQVFFDARLPTHVPDREGQLLCQWVTRI